MTNELIAQFGFIGLFIGFVGGYLGIGGAPLYIFLVGTFLGFPQHMAQGTIVAIMLGPMTLPGVIAMWGLVKKNLEYIFIAVLTYAIFSYFGAAAAYYFNNDSLRVIFATFLFALGVKYCRATDEDFTSTVLPLTRGTMTLIGIAAGVVGGFFGIGGGVVIIPILMRFFGRHKDEARAISLAVLAPPVSVGAVIKYHSMGHVNWILVLAGFTGYVISNYWGAKLGKSHSSGNFRFYFGLILATSAVLYAIPVLKLWISLAY